MEQQQPPTSINMELEDDLDRRRKRSLSSSSSESINTVDSSEADLKTVKTKHHNKKMCTQMTTPAELSESEGKTEVQADTPEQKQINNTPAPETNNSTQKQARYTRKPLTHKHHQTTQPLPIFEDHPVIIEEETGSSTTSLRSLDWKMNDILRGLIGTVRSIKPLSPNKILVGCQSKLQQSRLTKIKKIGETAVKCSIPVPTVIGVVRGIPQKVSMEEFQGKIESPYKIRKTTRMNMKDGTPSKAIQIIIEATHLPSLITINKREYTVTPFIGGPVQCYKCLRYGHQKKDCRAKGKACHTCGKIGHTPQQCTAIVRRCCNCQGEHSSAYLGCPARKERILASQIRSKTYMPHALACREAKIILHQRETMQEPQQEPAWRTISPANSYAGVVQGARPIPRLRRTLPTLPTGISKPTQQPPPAPTTPTPTDNNTMMEALLTALNDLKKQVADLQEENRRLQERMADQNNKDQTTRKNTTSPRPQNLNLQTVISACKGVTDEATIKLIVSNITGTLTDHGAQQ
ncbi:hypothetical protein ACOMHN_006685 [Nucella lapillus]